MNEYRVNLDIYNGPLDLLLYLIRRDEVDVCDIPIAAVTEQYIKYVDVLQQVDPNLAGEFLVMAATLMEIKSRMLLPAPPPEEGGETGVGLDPRAELVRQLLEYKAFKDAAGELLTAAQTQAMKFPRSPGVPGQEQGEFDLEDVQVWDLLDAFSKLMAAVGQQGRQHQVIYDDTPVELHADDIMDRLQREGPLTFSKVFEGRTNRGEIVGLFLALLELVRQKRVLAVQDSNFGDISIHVNPNAPAADAMDHVAEFADEQATPPSAPQDELTIAADKSGDAPTAADETDSADANNDNDVALDEKLQDEDGEDLDDADEEDEDDEEFDEDDDEDFDDEDDEDIDEEDESEGGEEDSAAKE